MKNIKRLLALMLSILMCMAIVSCGSKDDDEDDDDADKEKETVSLEVEGDPNCDHEWSDSTTTNKYPCMSSSTYTITCSKCGRVEIVRVEVPCGHVYNENYDKCEFCSSPIKSSCKHDTCKWTVMYEATCTLNGYKHLICESCKFVQDYDFIYSSGHDTISYEYKEATCTEDGNNYYYACQNCDYTSIEIYPALGHSYIAGKCTRCSEEDPSIKFIEEDEQEIKELNIDKITPSVKTADDATITTYDGNMETEKSSYTYTYTATYDGYIRVWLTEVYSGVQFKLYIKDNLNKNLTYNSYIENNEGLTQAVKAGETYTILLEGRSGTGTYKLHVGDQKAPFSVNEYTQINDKIEFVDQRNYYTFTPEISGSYRFEITELVNDAYISLTVYNHLGEKVDYNNYLYNNNGFSSKLTAGENYEIAVAYKSGIVGYTLNIGKQKETKDISDYTVINDSIEHKNQSNVYTFTAKEDGQVRFVITELTDDSYVELSALNYLNEKLTYDSYCKNNESISFTAKSGETYTIKVTYSYGMSDYTLKVKSSDSAVEMTSNTAYVDAIEYSEDCKIYNFKATESGDHIFAVSYLTDDYGYISITIKNKNGVEIAYDSSLYNNEYVTVEDIKKGEIYTVEIRNGYNTPKYTFAIQPVK